jgi:DNA modification methylase
MSIYYDDGRVTLHHGDALENDAWRLEGDVLVTDPPYGMAYVSNSSRYGSTAPIAGDDTVDARDKALRLWGTRPALVFGTWRATRPAATRQILVWDKGNSPGMGDLKLPWGPSWEEVYVLGEGFQGKRGGAVIRIKTIPAGSKDRPNHPTPKPIPLMETLIEKCPPGVIVDPFAGSGSTLLAAVNLGRRAIGVELDERYCELIAARLSARTETFIFEEA